mmetsp:Transcript_88807/g.254304  ORF Transcript_88807/g.254304 Transcript_88807/m.254304 type:complete len:321 (+) Transcript_88807:467-1429(+)
MDMPRIRPEILAARRSSRARSRSRSTAGASGTRPRPWRPRPSGESWRARPAPARRCRGGRARRRRRMRMPRSMRMVQACPRTSWPGGPQGNGAASRTPGPSRRKSRRTCACARTKSPGSGRKSGPSRARSGRRRSASPRSSTATKRPTMQAAPGSRTRRRWPPRMWTTSSVFCPRSGSTHGLATPWGSTRSAGSRSLRTCCCRPVWMALSRSGISRTSASACGRIWATTRACAMSILLLMGSDFIAFPTTRTSSTGILRLDRSSPRSLTRKPTSVWPCIPILLSKTSLSLGARTRRQCSGIPTRPASSRSTTSTWEPSTR